MWCHVLLGIPLFGLMLFVMFPFWMALPLYVLLTLGALALYRIIWRSMEREPATGVEALLGSMCRAATDISPKGWVKWRGETWRAVSSRQICEGDPVRILAYEDLCVLVEPEVENEGRRSVA